ncbi:MAG: hypothetical protein JJU34_11530 [Lunatimonas sp.]|uniref:hypothetical protein n=1 Tax=Lunatimonas sp. TaxID=2060141 RepID=UPI00263AC7E8|nr:hypothetical protein [Lunatimonas sp.]MCC5937902.1 hypothetical protein [Lunatimonas sp.]
MNRILNLICPTSHLEHFISRKTNDENIVNYFVTSLGLGLHLHKQDQAEQLKTTLQTLEIVEIRLFQDVYCPFIQNALEKARPREFYIDHILEGIYSEQAAMADFSKADYQSKAKKIAERNLVTQLEAMHGNPTLASYILQRNLVLKGIIVNKTEGAILREFKYLPRYSA